MPYYEDLSEYVYSRSGQACIVNVGWLDSKHPFNRGQVEPEVVLNIGELCKNPVNRKRGYQACEMCKDFPIREVVGRDEEPVTLGDGEIHIPGPNKVYACPTLIYHYIVRHGYRPPEEFLDVMRSQAAQK